MSRYLITTGLKETWPENMEEPVLFLGEWCRTFSMKEQWKEMNAKLMPYHWDDRSKLYHDYHYIQGLLERLLPTLGEKLNDFHCVDHSTRYWRILIGPWLGYFIQMLFDRWSSVDKANNEFELTGTTILKFPDESMIPNEMKDFANYFISDAWNHFIYSKIILKTTDIVPNYKNEIATHLYPHTVKDSKKINLNKIIAIKILSYLKLFSRETDSFFMATYLPRLIKLKLELKLRQIPQFNRPIPTSPTAINLLKRKWFLKFDYRSPFENFISSMIVKQIPTVYLEGYKKLVQDVANNGWPNRPKVIFTSNSETSDEHFKAYTAEKIEKGSQLIIGQHGGLYGMGLWSFTEDHHLAIADRYFSWGWKESNNTKIVPIGQLKMLKPKKKRLASKSSLLLVTTALPRHSYHMYSGSVSSQWLKYLEDQFTFCDFLPKEISQHINVRLKRDNEWEQEDRWRKRLPEIELDNGEKSLEKLTNECKIFVSTYNAATYLESFSMNIPTVMFWNPSHWEIRESAEPFLEILQKAEIFHDSPISAAKHITKIWGNVDEWWSSKKVSQAVNKFCNNYSYIPDNMSESLTKEIRKLY